MAVTAFDAGKAARDLERAGLDPAAAAAIMQAAAERRRGAFDSMPPWLAALLLGALLALLGWGALETRNTGERLALLERNTGLLEKKASALEEGQRKLEARVAGLEEGQRRLETKIDLVLERLPPRS